MVLRGIFLFLSYFSAALFTQVCLISDAPRSLPRTLPKHYRASQQSKCSSVAKWVSVLVISPRRQRAVAWTVSRVLSVLTDRQLTNWPAPSMMPICLRDDRYGKIKGTTRNQGPCVYRCARLLVSALQVMLPQSWMWSSHLCLIVT